MSEMAPERAPRRDNVFTRRIGPLPMWAWVAIVGGGILAWAWYRNRTAGSATSSGASAGVDASQVPQFVNQTYLATTPPVAGPPGPAGAGGPAGKPGVSGNAPGPTSNWPGGRQPLPVTTSRFPGTPQGRTERLRHKGNLEQIASRNHVNLEDLVEANPELKHWEGTGHMFPVGTTIRIPSQAA